MLVVVLVELEVVVVLVVVGFDADEVLLVNVLDVIKARTKRFLIGLMNWITCTSRAASGTESRCSTGGCWIRC